MAALATLPAVGEGDVCPTGDPRDAARLVLVADEEGFATYAKGPDYRRAVVARLRGAGRYRRQVEAAVRPTVFHIGGRVVPIPLASTRGDLDLVARAGARMWAVLGLGAADVLVSAVPAGPSVEHLVLTYAAIGAGAPAVFPVGGHEQTAVDQVASAVRAVGASVLAVPAAGAAGLVAALAGQADLSALRTVLLVGGGAAGEVEAVRRELGAAATVLEVYGSPDGRVLWAQCRESAAASTGYHTYPDLDVVQVVDPETGEPAPEGTGGEVVVTQLGFRGSALVRWRTGDLVDAPVTSGPCPACGRTVPRVPALVRPAALVGTVGVGAGTVGVGTVGAVGGGRGRAAVDLRLAAGVLLGRGDLADWRVEVGRSARTGLDRLLARVVAGGGADPAGTAVSVSRALHDALRVRPVQVVVDSGRLSAPTGGAVPVTARIAVRPEPG